MLMIAVSNIAARTLTVRSVQTDLLTNPYQSIEEILFTVPRHQEIDETLYENHNRHIREAYDPYGAYYYYPSSLNNRKLSERSTVNRRQAEDGVKSTQSKRRKLFVPNLFG